MSKAFISKISKNSKKGNVTIMDGNVSVIGNKSSGNLELNITDFVTAFSGGGGGGGGGGGAAAVAGGGDKGKVIENTDDVKSKKGKKINVDKSKILELLNQSTKNENDDKKCNEKDEDNFDENEYEKVEEFNEFENKLQIQQLER